MEGVEKFGELLSPSIEPCKPPKARQLRSLGIFWHCKAYYEHLETGKFCFNDGEIFTQIPCSEILSMCQAIVEIRQVKD